MISFENSEMIQQQQQYAESVAREWIRPQARYYDDHEHELPWDFARFIWDTGRKTLASLRPGAVVPDEPFMLQMLTTEMLSWGDFGMFMCIPWPALG